MRYLKYALIVLLFASCASKKGVVYFQDIDGSTLKKVDSVYSNPTIQFNDQLRISLSALDDKSLSPFKFTGGSATTEGIETAATAIDETYSVDMKGNIEFPVLGKLKLDGLTITQAQILLQDSLENYVTDPIVQIEIINFKFTVLGSANRPGTYNLDEESVNLLQAIGYAGDFSITGRRENVLIVREQDGQRISARVDFTSSNWMNSEFYYVKQNDVIYIEPNYAEVKTAGVVSDFAELLRALTVAVTTYILVTR